MIDIIENFVKVSVYNLNTLLRFDAVVNLETNVLGHQATYAMETCITNQVRHDCEKIAIAGLETASQDISS